VLSFRGAGDLIGEMAYFTGGRRSASVTALTDMHAVAVPGTRFAEFLGTHPRAAHLTAGILSNRLRAANERREEYTALDAAARVAHVVADVALRHALQVDGELVLGAAYTQADLASLASVSPRTIEKILKSFEEARLITRRRRELIVRDTEALRTIFNRMPQANYAGINLRSWMLDQLVNERGFGFDVKLAQAASEFLDAAREASRKLMLSNTDGNIASAMQAKKLLAYIRNRYDIDIESLRAGDVRDYLESDDLDPILRTVLEERLEAG